MHKMWPRLWEFRYSRVHYLKMGIMTLWWQTIAPTTRWWCFSGYTEKHDLGFARSQCRKQTREVTSEAIAKVRFSSWRWECAVIIALSPQVFGISEKLLELGDFSCLDFNRTAAGWPRKSFISQVSRCPLETCFVATFELTKRIHDSAKQQMA